MVEMITKISVFTWSSKQIMYHEGYSHVWSEFQLIMHYAFRIRRCNGNVISQGLLISAHVFHISQGIRWFKGKMHIQATLTYDISHIRK